MAHLITGYAGQEHIQSADQGSFNAAVIGEGQYVMDIGNKMSATITSNNNVRVSSGDIMMYGRHIRISTNYEDMTISTGSAGKNRIDLIVMTYEKDASSGIETAQLEVIKGTAVTGTPSAPSYTSGNILSGALKNQMPLYEVYVEGVVLKSLKSKFTLCKTYKTIAEEYEAEFIEACRTHLDSLDIINNYRGIYVEKEPNHLCSTLAANDMDWTLRQELAAKEHTHDDRYFTESESNSKMNGLLRTWTFTVTKSYNIQAGGATLVPVDGTWDGYTLLGVIGYNCALPINGYTNNNTVYARIFNPTSQATTVSNFEITCLYRKNM